MTCIGFALGLAILHCDLAQPAVQAARLCQVMTLPVQYARTDDPRTRLRLRALNAAWRSACAGR
ncbi:hypothetical protein [Methylobacterium sp. 13MFTsu3.1M2]|uniref:hypothetical protein n=1 Tax=Methylobacterium sp. 13MFTsu3.1M2 TaxID=1502776 RepID=UPI0008E921C6|nr:hypothetical protein [Methylobacterium sp. 13MFTsu3.1M2]SFE66603.1 hypothetical protein SAMN02799627_04008 [Methylobacterium sp. 13MFTsu3.1M2]